MVAGTTDNAREKGTGYRGPGTSEGEEGTGDRGPGTRDPERTGTEKPASRDRILSTRYLIPDTHSPQRAAGPRNSGYTMVIMVVAITVINILVAAAMPMWSTQAKREREEELVFRGLQYAEAIRVFQRRFGRLPVRLEELMEVEPRCIRQLWTDPMTGERDWGVIVNLGGRPGGGVSLPPGGAGQVPGQQQDDGRDPSTLPGTTGGPQLPVGPISGVYSRSKDEALRLFFDQATYDQWKFDVQLLINPLGQGGNAGATAGFPRLNAQWIGRPFRTPLPSGPQGGQPPTQPNPDGRPTLGGDPTRGRQ